MNKEEVMLSPPPRFRWGGSSQNSCASSFVPDNSIDDGELGRDGEEVHSVLGVYWLISRFRKAIASLKRPENVVAYAS